MTVWLDYDDWLERPVSEREHRDAELRHDLWRLRWAQRWAASHRGAASDLMRYYYHVSRAKPRPTILLPMPVIPGGLDLLTTKEYPMPKKVAYRKQCAWEQIAPRTFAIDLPHGLLIRYDTSSSGEAPSLVYAIGEELADVAPWEEREVCVDGDPDCGDPDCERKHDPPASSGSFSAPRFGKVRRLTIEGTRQWAVADGKSGRTISVPDEAFADALLAMLRAATGET